MSIALALAGAFAHRRGRRPTASLPSADAAASGTPPPPPTARRAASAPRAALPDFADLVAQHGPAVVQISVTQDAKKVAARGGRGMPDART